MVVQKKKCVFCDIGQGKNKTQAIIATSDNFFAIRTIEPVVRGHALVIPKKHFVTLLDIPNAFGDEFLKFTKTIAGSLLDDKYGDGFNIVMNNLACAGQAVMHAHLHIIPRSEGDGIHIGS